MTFFSQQCNTIDTDITPFCSIDFEITSRISPFDICNDEITRIIRYLDPNKTHEYDGISICMLYYALLLGCWNYALLQYQNLCPYFLNTVWKKSVFLTNEKMVSSSKNYGSKITDPYHYYMYVRKFWEDNI